MSIATSAPFKNYTELITEHARLNERLVRLGPGLDKDLAEEVKRFMDSAALTGVFLDNPTERSDVVSALRYWSSILFRSDGGEDYLPELLNFEESNAPDLANVSCPYIGLRAFGYSDRRLYRGRQDLVGELVSKCKSSNFIVVLGLSGSGKSSAVMAGLLPQLREGAIEGSSSFRYFVPLVPGSKPLQSLALALFGIGADENEGWSRLSASDPDPYGSAMKLATDLTAGKSVLEPLLVSPGRPVLVLDQFEEIFTLAPTKEAQALVRVLVGLATGNAKCLIVATMRSEYKGELNRCIDIDKPWISQVNPQPFTADEFRAAIEVPAQDVNLRFEEGIVDSLVSKVVGAPNALPLLQFTLTELWKTKNRNRITWEMYSAVGDPLVALELKANALRRELPQYSQVVLDKLLLKMVQPGPYDQPISKRATLSDLRTVDEAEIVDDLLQKLCNASLVKVSRGATQGDIQYEMAHESLGRNWTHLRDLVSSKLEESQERLTITRNADLWLKTRKSSLLLSGDILRKARNYNDLSVSEKLYLQTSTRRINLVWSFIVTVTVVFITSGWWASTKLNELRSNASKLNADKLAYAQEEINLKSAIKVAQDKLAKSTSDLRISEASQNDRKTKLNYIEQKRAVEQKKLDEITKQKAEITQQKAEITKKLLEANSQLNSQRMLNDKYQRIDIVQVAASTNDVDTKLLALQIAQQQGNPWIVGQIMATIANFYSESADGKQALPYWQESAASLKHARSEAKKKNQEIQYYKIYADALQHVGRVGDANFAREQFANLELKFARNIDLRRLDQSKWKYGVNHLGNPAATPLFRLLNPQKNRDWTGARASRDFTVDGFQGFVNSLDDQLNIKGRTRDRLTADELHALQNAENQVLSITGRLELFYDYGSESANFGDPTFHGWTLVLMPDSTPETTDPQAILGVGCEITRFTERNLAEKGVHLQRCAAFVQINRLRSSVQIDREDKPQILSTGHSSHRVRVTGYLLRNDALLGSATMKEFFRTTCWELHPVTAIQDLGN